MRIIIVIVDDDGHSDLYIKNIVRALSSRKKGKFSIKNTKSRENKNLMDDKKDTKALRYRSVEQQ